MRDLMEAAAREWLSPALGDRETAWARTRSSVVGQAAAQGIVNSPESRGQIAGLLRLEMRFRAEMCADAVLGVAATGDDESDRPEHGHLVNVAEILFEECAAELFQMREGFASIPGGREMPSADEYRVEARQAIAGRIDAGLAGAVG